jgi:hypothetical protein
MTTNTEQKLRIQFIYRKDNVKKMCISKGILPYSGDQSHQHTCHKLCNAYCAAKPGSYNHKIYIQISIPHAYRKA